MKDVANIKLSAVRLTAGFLMILLCLVSNIQYFHYHEDQVTEAHSEEEHHSETDSCVICDYFVHKHSTTFIVSGETEFKIFALFVFILLYEVIIQEIKACKQYPSNKAPPQFS